MTNTTSQRGIYYSSFKDNHYRHPAQAIRFKEKYVEVPSTRLKYADAPKKQFTDSFDTCESENADCRTARLQEVQDCKRRVRLNKIKVQLCRNFIQKGYCPYENRCRFAHGVEELRAKNTDGNSQLYRTRNCKVFFEKNQCKFGQRCNFLHENRTLQKIHSEGQSSVRTSIRINFIEIMIESKQNNTQSRLLRLLNKK